MTVLVQVSDPHFGTERVAVVDALERWIGGVAPDVLVLSGDITQRSRRAQWDAAREFVARLRVPAVVAVPGNHDIALYDVATRALRPYAEFARAFGPRLEPEHESDWLLVVGVNTTRQWRHKDGEVSPEQVERVAARLERARPGQLRVVVVHQPILTVRPQDEPDRLHGAERASRRWAEAGADLVLGGHIHLPYVAPIHERLPGLARRVWAVQAGTAVSRRVRHEAGNSVNLVRWPVRGAVDVCEVERWDCDDPAAGFVRVSVERLEPDRSGTAPRR